MKLTNLIAALVFLLSSTFCFSQSNAASFDGTTGYISVPEASAFIPATGLTIEAWVYPRNPAPAWPDFDGIFGLRNDVDCDFYMLHLNTTDIEARFRNSEGQDFTITHGGIQINEWNHIAFSYGSEKVTYYLNGEFQASLPATGECGSIDVPLLMGKLDFNGGATFWYDGGLDEVRFWSEERTEEQIQEYMLCELQEPENMPTLAYYYDLNEEENSPTAEDRGDIGFTGEVIDGVIFVESTVNFKVPNSIKLSNDSKFSIAPNPTYSSRVILSINNPLDITDIKICNINGQIRSVNKDNIVNGKLEIEELSAGAYFIHVSSTNSTTTEKLIVF